MHQVIDTKQMFQQDKVIVLLSLDQLLKPNQIFINTHISIVSKNIFNE